MASFMIRRTLLVCRSSCVVRASGAFTCQSSSRWARNCCAGVVQHGRQWRLVAVIGREFSRERKEGGPRLAVNIAALSNRAGPVKEQAENDSGELEQDEEEAGDEKISRNASKKQSARAREWGRELATLSPAQLRQACAWASLDEDVYDAVMLVKNLGTSQRVKHGRRRQYNYIGGLLRDVDWETMESVLKATKNGDVEGLALSTFNQPDDVNDVFEEKPDETQEEDGVIEEAESWLEGLVAGDRAVEDDVYSIYDVDFDRQELRKLIREARKYEIQPTAYLETADAAEGGQELPSLQSKREKAQKALLQFLVKIVKERRHSAYSSTVQ